MKKFVFALLTFVFTSFAFASPPLELSKQKVEKIEFAKQVTDQVIVVAFVDQESFLLLSYERKPKKNKDFTSFDYYCESETINLNPVPITDIYKEWNYIIDKRKLLRIFSHRNFKL